MTELEVEVFDDQTPRLGAENMRRDADLLQQAATGSAKNSVVRIYEWSEPTVTLGYFQQEDADPGHRLKNCPRIKRLTGGGAILHHHEFTYSVVTPLNHPARQNPYQLYQIVHGQIIHLLRDFGVEACLRKDQQARIDNSTTKEPYLCFFRADDNDIVLDGRKIVGSAQRRRKGAILQHGSIVIQKSELTPEILGIADLAQSFDTAGFRNRLPAVIAESLRRSEV